MRFVVAETYRNTDLLETARKREDQGWSGIGIGDHYLINGRPCPHMASMLGYFAAVTDRLRLVTTYANSLLRTPVEYAHMALTVHRLSGGRFEAGLGSGWAQDEIEAHGIDFSDAPERARRYREAAIIVGELLRTGRCHYQGDFYRAAVDDMAVPVQTRPPLGVAVGGPWTAANLSPLADWIEIAPFAHTFRSGTTDMSKNAEGDRSDVERLVSIAKTANPSARLSIGCFVAVGSNGAVQAHRGDFGDGPFSGLAGAAGQVADTLDSFAELGFSDCTLMELVPGSIEALAPRLL